jgi:flavin reductase (DIM6/NTAB) family NADH-FMN oxidoreductase RutF
MTERLVPGQRTPPPRSRPSGEHVDGVAEALASFPTGITLVMVADGRDDIGTTVSAFCPVSLSPPLVLVSLIAGSYPAEVLGRVDRFAVTMLAAGQRALAGRFAAAGRPGARLLLEGVPHQRGPASGALIPDGGVAALECEAVQHVPAGDHLLIIASVLRVPYVAEAGEPLIRFAGRYPGLR